MFEWIDNNHSASNIRNNKKQEFIKIFKSIYKQYIEADYSPFEVNISYQEKDSLKSNYLSITKKEKQNQMNQYDINEY